MKSRIYYFIFSIIFILLLIQSGEKFFNPDSWTYLELSKTVFSEDFYKFKFQRSFATQEISSAYPFGYPILIAIFNLFIKNYITSMLVINGISILAILYLLKKITSKLNINIDFILLSIIFSFAFMDEVLAGRSIAITILIYLIGINFFINGHKSISFFLIGLTAIFRFDFLAISILTLIYLNFKNNFPFYKNLFFLVGLSPWVIFSIFKFNTLYATDNSWVATSSNYLSYGLDFNTSPENIFENFPGFVDKISKTITHIFPIIIARNFLVAPIISILFLELLTSIFDCFKKNKLFYFLFILSICPYLLTGYFTQRYFLIHALIISIFLSYDSKLLFEKQKYFIFTICCLATFYKGYTRISYSPNIIEEKKLITDLEKKQENKNYIFYDIRFGAKYSALTMKPTTAMPSDFERLDSIQRNNFLSSMGEYEFICTGFEPDN